MAIGAASGCLMSELPIVGGDEFDDIADDDFPPPLPDPPEKLVGPYALSDTLGRGAAGKVKLGRHKETGQLVAVKIVRKEVPGRASDFIAKVRRETALMQVLDHPNLLRLLDVLESDRRLYLVLEYAQGGELFEYIANRRCLSENEAMRMFRQMVYGLECMHMLGIAHRDLKTENVLLDGELTVKISDFGFARFTKNQITMTSCGSPHYAAPEVVRGQRYNPLLSDIWSLGVCLYGMCAGYLPFDDPSLPGLLRRVRQGTYEMPASFSAPVKDLISRMLQITPTMRPCVSEIKAHPAFRMGLPPGYALPVPIPIGSCMGRVDLASVTPSEIDLLQRLGCGARAEVERELEASEANFCKRFHAMHSNAMNVFALPWDEQVADAGPDLSAVEESVSGRRAGSWYAGQRPFSTPVAKQRLGSSPVSSVLSLPELLQSVDQEGEVGVAGIAVEVLFAALQRDVTERGGKWFHPDPFRLIVRINEDALYAELRYTRDLLRVLLLFGAPEAFAEFCRALEAAINAVRGRA